MQARILTRPPQLLQISMSMLKAPEEFRHYQEAVGHGAGLQIEFPLICGRDEMGRMPYPEMTLEPGIVICAEAYIGAVGGREGVMLEQQLLVTEAGPEILSGLGFDNQLLG